VREGKQLKRSGVHRDPCLVGTSISVIVTRLLDRRSEKGNQFPMWVPPNLLSNDTSFSVGH
jgi:hypothetical protein